jgi:hypothetical protein
MFNRLREYRTERLNRAIQDLIDHIRFIESLDDEEQAEGKTAGLITDAPYDVIDGLLEGFRYHVEAIDEAAHPYIARLYGGYLHEKKSRDVFFRRAGVMLSNISKDELGRVGELIQFAAQWVKDHVPADFDHDRQSYLEVSGLVQGEIRISWVLGGTPKQQENRAADLNQAIQTLQRYQLCSSEPARIHGGPVSLRFELAPGFGFWHQLAWLFRD